MKFKRYKKDLKKRKFHKKNELFQKIFKILFLYSHDIYLKLLINKKQKLKNSYKTKIKNYCIISGRSRSIFKKLKVSRINLKILNNNGEIFGLKKITW